jgi:hypothetical protein
VRVCSNLVVVLAREDVEVHLHALQTTTEQSIYVNGGTVVLEKFIVVRKRLHYGMHMITQRILVLTPLQ